MQLFYPSHDIALAHGVRHFNPPAAALRLQEDLAFLADIWNQPYLQGESLIPLPWGWDWDTREHIHRQYGIRMSMLPTDEQLEQIRQISNRRTSIYCFEHLYELINTSRSNQTSVTDDIAPIGGFSPQYIDSENKLWNFITTHDAAGKPFVLKSPWSSSGRGLHVSFTRSDTGLKVEHSRTIMMRQAMGTIQKMGGIMGEEWIDDKVQDFAMLFYASDRDVHFIGYSLFDNDTPTAGVTYRQGYLLSNEAIANRLALPFGCLAFIAHSYETILTELLQPFFGNAWHLGYLGIDMMTYREPSEVDEIKPIKVHPCVELNLRCTMGVVCRLWYDKHPTNGVFRISPMLHNRHFKAEFLTTE